MDQHLHTTLSADGESTMEEMCARALELGMRHICFTEHIDYGHPQSDAFTLDYAAYDAQLACCRERFPELFIGKGVEAGVLPVTAAQTAADVAAQRFDLVIGSLHVVDGIDPYYPEFYQGRDRRECLRRYVENLARLPELLPDFDILSHIGYVTKFAPFANQPLEYEEFPEALDQLLRGLIQRGQGLEVNTSGYNVSSAPFPTPSILRRYRQLGGELVTLSSDAHSTAKLGQHFNRARALLRELGFTHIALYRQRQPQFVAI